MPEMPAETQKRKRALPRQWGCLRLLLIPIVLTVACYGGMWVFARYGGEWAINDQIPVPPGSKWIKDSFPIPDSEDANYISKSSLYFHSWTPEELHIWFEQKGISFLPKCIDAKSAYEECHNWDLQYFGVSEKWPKTFRLNFYKASIFLTVPNSEWGNGWVTQPRTYVKIYENQEELDTTASYFKSNTSILDVTLPEHKIAFSIGTITPKTLSEWLNTSYSEP